MTTNQIIQVSQNAGLVLRGLGDYNDLAGKCYQASDHLAANEKLLNAAPELLAALKQITEHCRLTIAEYRRFAKEHGKDAIHPLDDAIMNQAVAAISKATP